MPVYTASSVLETSELGNLYRQHLQRRHHQFIGLIVAKCGSLLMDSFLKAALIAALALAVIVVDQGLYFASTSKISVNVKF